MILTFDSVGWFFDKFRGFFGSIDYLIYSLISWVVEGIFNLSSLATNPTLAHEIYQRIYVILAIFMVFKLSFSFIKYLVSPDTMTDKEQGVGKLIARTVTMLAILIMLPVLFFSTDLPYMEGETVLTVLQNGVVKTIPKIILGVADTEDSISKSARENGDYMALMMIGSFYYPSKCNPDSDNYIGEKEATRTCSFTDFGDYNGDGEVNLKDFYSTINNEGDSDEYEFQYMWPLTTIAGVLLIVILGGICIDVAIRVFKLLVLEMMAPIPVMTYIDPKSSKDGAFSKWLGSFVSTYVDLFVKLATVYLLLLLISKMFANGKGALFANGGISSIDGVMSRNLVRVFLVIGLFKFAKDAPKFIKDAMGIKDSGGGGGFMGKALAGMAGAAAGFAGGVATGGLAGGLSGIMTGASAGFAGKPGQAFSQVRDEQAKLLGKTPGGVKGKLQNKAMQRSVMKHTGLDTKKLEEMKKAKLQADDELAIAEADYANGKIDAEALKKARKKAGTANSAYENANSLAKQIGLKPGFMEENKRHGDAYIAAARIRKNIDTTASSVKGKINDLPSTQWIKDKASDISDIPTNIRHSIDSAVYGGDDNADRLEARRENVRAGKDLYKETLRGGIGNTYDKDDVDTARDMLKEARKDYKKDKKDFRS